MKNAMWKNNLREIARTPGRYAAMVCIIALGVGFFSGLTVTKKTMLGEGNNYVAENQLYDYKLLSTLGFEEEEVEKLAALDHVLLAEGGYSFDFLAREDDADVVLTALSLSERMNRLTLTAGRMPENGEECLADSLVYPESAIGDVITLSSENEEDTLDAFSSRTYTIVGTAISPEYMNIQRGTSRLGGGRVKGFVYLTKDGFRSEYYTTAYVKLEEDRTIFTDEYDDLMEEVREPVTDTAEEAVLGRYRRLVSNAEQELADGEKEYEDGLKEFADAKEELNDGEDALQSAEAAYADGVTALAEGESTLAQSREELNDGEEALAKAEQELADNEAAFAEQSEVWEKSRGELETAIAALRAMGGAPGTIAAYEAQLTEGNRAMEEASAALTEARQTLAKRRKEADDGWDALAAGEAELEENRKKLEDAAEEIRKNRLSLDDGWKELEENRQKLSDAAAELEDGRADLASFTADGEPKVYVLTRYENNGYASFEGDSSIVEGIAKVFPVIFFLVAALVCSTTMTKMVDEERTQIGTLKALGYGRGAIMAKYTGYAASAAVLGTLIGFFSCTKLFPAAIWTAYTMLYDFTDTLSYVFDGKLLLLSLGIALLCSVGAALLSCWAALREKPAELIRPKAPKAGKRILLERAPMLWKRVKFLHKVSIRNIFRYKKRLFMMMLGIGGCTALVLVGLGLRDSIQNIVTYQFEEIAKYDLTVTLTNPADEAFLAQFEEETKGTLSLFAPVYESAVDLPVEDGILSVQMIAADASGALPQLIDLHHGDEALPYPEDGQVILNRKAAEMGGYQIGDKVELRVSEGERITATLSGICESYVYNYAYLTPQTFEKNLGTAPEARTIYASLSDTTTAESPHKAAAFLMNLDGVANVSLSADMKDRVGDMMESMNFVILLVIGCAAALAFVVLFNLSNINITERAREIATIKVLGFYPAEVSQYVFRENMVLTAFGAAVGMPLGILLHRFVMSQIQIDMVTFDVRITPQSFLLAVVLTFVFAIAVGFMMQPKLAHISMADSLKSVE